MGHKPHHQRSVCRGRLLEVDYRALGLGVLEVDGLDPTQPTISADTPISKKSLNKTYFPQNVKKSLRWVSVVADAMLETCTG